MKEETTICQSCGMPIHEEEHYATNADGTKNHETCSFCMERGIYSHKTMDELLEDILPRMVRANIGMTDDEGRKRFEEIYPTLRRWSGL